MQRLPLFLIPSLIAIVLFIAISSFDSASTQSGLEENSVALNFDAYSEGINSILYDETGAINYTLQANSQIHYKDDVTELESPLLRLFENGDSRWNIVANSGRISASSTDRDGGEQTIDLIGNVEVHSIDEFGNRIIITTEFLTVNPDKESLQTEEAVKLVTSTIEQTAVGMYADLIQEEIILKREVRGRYEPPRP